MHYVIKIYLGVQGVNFIFFNIIANNVMQCCVIYYIITENRKCYKENQILCFSIRTVSPTKKFKGWKSSLKGKSQNTLIIAIYLFIFYRNTRLRHRVCDLQSNGSRIDNESADRTIFSFLKWSIIVKKTSPSSPFHIYTRKPTAERRRFPGCLALYKLISE